MKFKSVFITCLFIPVLLTSFLVPVNKVYAQEDKGAVTVPTLIAPRLMISLTSPTYKWTKISSANLYQLQVYQGSANLIDIYVATTSCIASTCKITTTTILTYTTYKWRVRARFGSTWQAWSPYSYFMVSAAFNAQFNGNTNGWQSAGGLWYPGSEYVYTKNMADNYWSNFARNVTTYTNFDFSARVKRPTTLTDFSGLVIRMGSGLSSNNYWYPGYSFTYDNEGDYVIWRRNADGTSTALQSITSTSALHAYDWNVLRIIALGSTFHFYINGTLVRSVSDVFFYDGYVGFTMVSSSTADEFQVDWARLTPLDAAFKVTDTISPEQQALNDAANLGIPLTSENNN